MSQPDIHIARFGQLCTVDLHDLLRLRVDVFVVEQNCAYPELDGRDREPGTWHVWTVDASGPTAYLRVLADGAQARIGRVCTRANARGQGLAALLMGRAVELTDGYVVVLAAQSQLAGWYARFGFAVDGAEFLEDGIAHVPMRRQIEGA